MKVAVVTPYFRPDLDALHQCYRSVRAQTHACTQIFIADGEPLDIVDKFDGLHIKSHGPNNDVGNTARALGSIIAMRQGFDAIAYLDADNWYAPTHIARMVALHKTSEAAVCSAARNLHHLDGTYLGRCAECDGQFFVDTNCLFLTKDAFPVISVWFNMDRGLDAVGDRVVWFQIQQLGYSTAHDVEASVHYRTTYRGHYEQLKIAPPPDAKGGDDVQQSRMLFETLREKARRGQAADREKAGLDRTLVRGDGLSQQRAFPRCVLVSLIGMPRRQIDQVLDDLIDDSKAEGTTPVFITDEVELAVEIGRQALVEHLPSVRNREAAAPDLDWDLYLKRRLRQIQEKWRCSKIIVLGLPLDHVLAGTEAPAAPGS